MLNACMSDDSIDSQRIPFMATTYLYLSYWAIYILCSENNHLSSRRLEHRQTIFSRDLISYFTLIWSKESNFQENLLIQIAEHFWNFQWYQRTRNLRLKNEAHVNIIYTRIGNVCPGWPVYGVKCLCSRGGNEAFQYLILVIWSRED